ETNTFNRHVFDTIRICTYCDARLFPTETQGTCCGFGKIKLSSADDTSILDRLNPFVVNFRSISSASNITELRLLIRADHGLDQRTYNMPTTSQVAAVWVEGNDHINYTERDIIVQSRSQGLQRVSELSGCYDPMQYPLLFPRGDYGWHPGILQNTSQKKVTMRQYYSYKLHFRELSSTLLFFGGRLLQQYVVDNYVKIESSRLSYLRFNQDKIRKEYYQGLHDSVQSGIINASEVGCRVILPSSFMGDAMALVQAYGKPDIFITITCNPWWPEITAELLPMQTPQDRPDLT
ncbi:23865_t:CDS:2, partial [Racocetra persica]